MLETITMSDLHINKLKISSFFSKLKILKKKKHVVIISPQFIIFNKKYKKMWFKVKKI